MLTSISRTNGSWLLTIESTCVTTQNAVLKATAGIISLLTHICIHVAFNIVVHLTDI